MIHYRAAMMRCLCLFCFRRISKTSDVFAELSNSNFFIIDYQYFIKF